MQELANRLGVPLSTLDGVKASAVWQCVAKSPTMVHVRFQDTGKYGGTTDTNKDGSITVTVDPTRWISPSAGFQRSPARLLATLLHELIHAALRLKCGSLPNGVTDRQHDPKYNEGNYPDDGNDVNNAGEQYIRSLLPDLTYGAPWRPVRPGQI